MNRKDKAVLGKITRWLETQNARGEKEEIEDSLNDIKYDVENFIKGIRFHTEKFRGEIGSEADESLEALEKNQFVSRGEFVKEIKKQV